MKKTKVDTITKNDNMGRAQGHSFVTTRKLSDQEVRAFRRIYLKITFKKRALQLGVFFVTFLVLSTFSYLYINFDALKGQLTFDEDQNNALFNQKKSNMAEQSVAGSSDENSNSSKFIATSNRLEIPKLNLIGNILYPESEKNLEKHLDNGIVHVPQSVNPGEFGNSIFTAHSSSTKRGYYSNIFSGLNRLDSGDIIMLYRGNDIYLYKVIKKEVIAPQYENLKKIDSETLTLLTCWPIGSDEKRLVVYAERI